MESSVTIYIKDHEYELNKVAVRDIATKILTAMSKDINFMGPNRRNDDTVNMLICCEITGTDVSDFISIAEYPTLVSALSGYHRDRIEPYVEIWCPDGQEYLGFRYLIMTDYVEDILSDYIGTYLCEEV